MSKPRWLIAGLAAINAVLLAGLLLHGSADTAAYGQAVHRVILGFNVDLLPDAKEALPNYPSMKVFTNDVVYRLIEDYQKWVEEEKRKLDLEKRAEYAFPGKIRLLPNCVFRTSKPAIVGVRVLAGRIAGQHRLLVAPHPPAAPGKPGGNFGGQQSIGHGGKMGRRAALVNAPGGQPPKRPAAHRAPPAGAPALRRWGFRRGR